MRSRIVEKKDKNPKGSSSAAFKAGAVALAFIIIGYQTALFVHRAAVMRIEANRDRPDTVYVTDAARGAATDSVFDNGTARTSGTSHGNSGGRRSFSSSGRSFSGSGHPTGTVTERHYAPHSEIVKEIRNKNRRVESFTFNPNTAGVEDLVRLGFTQKQAQAIDNYRARGGRFRRKSDFAKSFVVSDSVFARLESYIDIPKVDINKADSAAFDDLPGIGPYFAAQMVSYRDKVGGYACPEQLLDIYNFGQERFDGLKDLIICSRQSR